MGVENYIIDKYIKDERPAHWASRDTVTLFISTQSFRENPILTSCLLIIRYEWSRWQAPLDTPYLCNLHKKKMMW